MYDIVIRGGTVFSGAKEEGRLADLAIKGRVIKKIGIIKEGEGKTEINAKGKYVTPGFIDVQNHSDGYWTIFREPRQESLLRQGVTTILCGSDGSSIAPLPSPRAIETIRRWVDVRDLTINWMTLAELFRTLERGGLGVNFATLTGHATLRRGLVPEEWRALSDAEQKALEKMYEKALAEGSFGFSTALAYSHEHFAPREELLPFLRLTAKERGIYATHLRDEGEKLPEAVDEALDAARESGVSLLISHLKAKGAKAWPKFNEALEKIEKAAGAGVNVHFNVYPYAITSSVLYAYLPTWVTEGGREAMLRRLKSPVERQRLVREMNGLGRSWQDLIVAMCPFNPHLVGKSLGEMGENRGLSPAEMVIEILIAGGGHVLVFDHTLDEGNVERAVSHPLSLVASSGAGYSEHSKDAGQLVHPRCFGTFPRFLGQYVRERKLLAWHEAIHKITGQAATVAGITGRGFIAKGVAADVVVFDPARIRDRADFEHPFRYAQGIEWVMVNGKIAVGDGSTELAGEILRHRA